MVNNFEFSDRLKTVINHYELTATSLADSINVQRSSISHLLSGRNKPSLDFVLKILQKYPEVELYWLLNGKGQFPKKEIENKTTEYSTLPFNDLNKKDSEVLQKKQQAEDSDIEKIVFFYKNGTFKSYKP